MKRERAKTKVPTWTRPARTAYELLGRVCKAIQAEPERYDQERFCPNLLDDTNRPPCGTAFCVGGWMVFLHDGRFVRGSIEDRGSELLGIDNDIYHLRSWELFTTQVPGATLSYPSAGPLPNQGTPAYAKAGVAHTRRFMKKYEGHLKSRLLKGV